MNHQRAAFRYLAPPAVIPFQPRDGDTEGGAGGRDVGENQIFVSTGEMAGWDIPYTSCQYR